MVRFEALDCWYEQLPPQQQQEVRALCAQVRSKLGSSRIVPEGHGSRLPQQVETAKRRFLECRDPFCLIRIGDSELGLLGAHFLPEEIHRPISWYMNRGDLTNMTLDCRNDFIAAIKGAELLGVQQNWKPITDGTAIILGMLGLKLPMENAVEVHVPYQLLVDGSLFRWLEGKRVLLIGSLAPKLSELWHTKAFQAAYKPWGPVDKVSIVGAIQTRSKSEGGAFQDYSEILRKIDQVQFDVALLSCGVTAKPLTWAIRKRERTAVDVGFVFNALLGGGERTQRPILREVQWPSGTDWGTR
jgi:hypothetical protein